MIYVGKNEDRYQAVRQALNELNPVIRGTIIIKPDLPGTDVAPGGFTQISFVRAVVDWIRDKGNPKRVLIAEAGTSEPTQEIFQKLGYQELIQTVKNGRNIDLFDINQDQGYDIEFVDARGEKMRLPVSATALDADFMISLSLLKTHDHVALSGAIPNLANFVVGGANRLKLHGWEGKKPHEMDDGELARGAQAYSENLLTLYKLFEPDMLIIDGNGQEGNGPVRGNLKSTDLVVASDDALKADVISAQLMGLPPEEIPYIKLAEKDGLEPYADLDVRGLDPSDVHAEFTPHKRARQMQIGESA